MIILGVSEHTRKALSRALTRAFQRNHDDDTGALFLLIGVVLALIGIYFLYEWLTAPKPQKNPDADQAAPAEPGSPVAGVAFLALGMIFFLLGATLAPHSMESDAGTKPAEQGADAYMAHKLREKRARASETFGSEDFTLSSRGAFQLPKLARPPRTEIWLGQLELPKLAQGLRAQTPWIWTSKLVLTPRSLVETSDYSLEYTRIRWQSKSRKVPGESAPAGDGAAPGKEGGAPSGR